MPKFSNSFRNNFFRLTLLFIIIIFSIFWSDLFMPSKVNLDSSLSNSFHQLTIKTFKNDFFKLKIVIPFHINQLNKLLDNLEKWKLFKPCLDNNHNYNIDLVFYIGYSQSNEKILNQINTEIPHRIDCFSKISIVMHKYNSTSQDKHVMGSRLMFEYMLNKTYNEFRNTTFIFYMEPDVRVIKSNWLEAILKEIGNGNFWIKGSIFRGDMKKFAPNDPYLPNYVHINGNAIYKIGDINLSNFYFNILRPYVVKKNGDSKNAYDTDFFEFLFDKDNYELTRNIIHYFQFTNLIQNYWQTEYKINEISEKFYDTYFIHGGYPIY